MLWFKVWCNAKRVGVDANRFYYTQVSGEMQGGLFYGEIMGIASVLSESRIRQIERIPASMLPEGSRQVDRFRESRFVGRFKAI